MHRGYVKLWRKIQDAGIWTQEKFTRGQAWVDLVLLANHKPGHIRIRGIKINIARGQLAHSELTLSNRWRWSRGKTRRFLQELSSNPVQQIEQQKNNLTTLITIINYEQYQGTVQQNEHQTVQQTDTKRYTNKNDKNVKNDKNIYKNIVEYLNKKTSKNYKYNSKETIYLIKARLNTGFTEQDFYTVIDNKCSKWLTDPKMIEYLRPQTLFGTKFETYLQDIPRKLQPLKPTTYSQAKDAEGRAMAKWVKGQKDEECNSDGTRQIPAKLP